MSVEQTTRYKGEFANSAESSSGIFCWSTSQSSNSKRSEQELSTSSASDGLIIRIPGPQVCLFYSSLTFKYLIDDT